MQEYIFNVFYWWFGIVVRKTWERFVYQYIYILQKTDTLSMAKNFFVPLYRDRSIGGIVMGVLIRFWWVAIGSIVSTILVTPYFVWALFITILIFIPVIQVIHFI